MFDSSFDNSVNEVRHLPQARNGQMQASAILNINAQLIGDDVANENEGSEF